MTLPTIALVPGAWHTPFHYAKLTAALQRLGYEIAAEQLPSVGSDFPKEQTVEGDVAFLRERVLLPLIEAGKEVVLVAHSYGGIVAGVAAKGLGKVERQTAGLKGGIVGLMWIAAFVLGEMESMTSLDPDGEYPYSVPDVEKGVFTLTQVEKYMYNGVQPAEIPALETALKTQAISAFTSPIPAPGWSDKSYDGRRVYLLALQDMALPTHAQEGMVGASGVEWDIRKFDTGHSPFASETQKTLDLIVESAEKWSSS